MIYEEFDLKDRVQGLKKSAFIHTYCIENHEEYSLNVKRKTIIVIPGGGYQYCSHRENEPVALAMLAHDFNAFSIEYPCNGDIEFPYPMLQVFALVAYIRSNADRYNVDPNEIYVLGFSAGGHLAASASCYCKEKKFADMLGVNVEDIKINGCLLGYPVILMDPNETHLGTMEMISEGRKPELLDFFDIIKHIDKDFPRTFIYETACDQAVPPVNTFKLKDRLDELGVENVLDLYKWGLHGSSIATRAVYYDQKQEYIDILRPNREWIDKMANFINRNSDY